MKRGVQVAGREELHEIGILATAVLEDGCRHVVRVRADHLHRLQHDSGESARPISRDDSGRCDRGQFECGFLWTAWSRASQGLPDSSQGLRGMAPGARLLPARTGGGQGAEGDLRERARRRIP
jgi:hypothetical protein